MSIKTSMPLFLKLLGAFVILLIMALCQFHKPTIEIPKEMWTIISGILTYIFMGLFPKTKMPLYGESIKGFITLILLIMVSLSIYFGINVGREWWSIVGVAVAFTYGNGGSN